MDIVLIRPQIPQNTGSIARTCAATNTPLHLVGKLGFDISEKAVRRAGLDYWPYVNLHRHAGWEAYLEAANPRRVWAFSNFGRRAYYEAELGESDALVFGPETVGLGEEFLARIPPEQVLLIPMDRPEVRSLNLSNSVAIALYEARRQWAVSQIVRTS